MQSSCPEGKGACLAEKPKDAIHLHGTGPDRGLLPPTQSGPRGTPGRPAVSAGAQAPGPGPKARKPRPGNRARLSMTDKGAATYSPTGSPRQYHRRWRA